MSGNPSSTTSVDVSRRIAKAAMWVTIARASQRSLSIVRIVILARLLLPQDFGLIGIAVTLRFMVDSLSSWGYHTALIQKEGDIGPYLNTVWTLDLIRRGLIGTALVLLAPLLADLYTTPEATPMIRIIGFALVIAGTGNVATLMLRKELRSRDELLVKLGSTVVDTIVTIALVFWLMSALAMAWGILAGVIASVVFSYLVIPYKPGFALDFGQIKELFGYGRWMALQYHLGVVGSQMDRLVIARVLGSTALGFYTVALRLAFSVTEELTQLVVRVGFPALALVQASKSAVRNKSLHMLEMAMLLAGPSAVTIAMFSDPLIAALVGEKWAAAAGVVRILAFVSVPLTLLKVGRIPLEATGYPKPGTVLQFCAFGIIAVLLWPFSSLWGLEGAAWAMFAGYASVVLPLYVIWRTHLAVGLVQIAAALMPALLTTIALGSLYKIMQATHLTSNYSIIIVVIIGPIAYMAMMYGYWRLRHRGPFLLIARALNRSQGEDSIK